jgi:hypothetical protein
MHQRPHRIDRAATEARLFYDPRSYISLRVHPSGNGHQCVYLAGKDKEIRRRCVFDRDGWRCVLCGTHVSWNSGELMHGGHTKVERCDCMENLSTGCRPCHTREHGRDPRWKSNEPSEKRPSV